MPRRRGLLVLILGLVCMIVVAPVVSIAIIFSGVMKITDLNFPVGNPVAAGSTIELPADQREVVLVAGELIDHSCVVTSPGSRPLPLTQQSSSTEVTIDLEGSRYTESARFTTTEAGAYQVSCGDGAAVISASSFDSHFRNLVTRIVVGALIGVLLGLIGLVLLILGIIRLVRSGRERSNYRLAQATGGMPYGGFPGTPYSGGYPQQEYPPQDPGPNWQEPYQK
jgi:hypothetical protein